MILRALEGSRPLRGTDIRRLLGNEFGILGSEGSFYMALHKLVKKGLLAQEDFTDIAMHRFVRYRLTGAGAKMLQLARAALMKELGNGRSG